MQNELQITFHQIPHSEALETEIRQRAAELDALFEGITSCRVVVESPHRHQSNGRHFHVGIELAVPGKRLAVGHQHDNQPGHEDPYVAARDAFGAIRRQLQDHVRVHRRAG